MALHGKPAEGSPVRTGAEDVDINAVPNNTTAGGRQDQLNVDEAEPVALTQRDELQ